MPKFFQSIYYYIKDHIGNIQVTVNQDSDIVTKDDYYPFGLRMGGMSYNSGNPNDRFKYSSKELDEELGLNKYHFGWRDYDPEIGRWHVKDPLAYLSPEVSPYHYVHNDPINRIDPFGLDDGNKKKGDKVDGGGDDNFLERLVKSVVNFFESLVPNYDPNTPPTECVDVKKIVDDAVEKVGLKTGNTAIKTAKTILHNINNEGVKPLHIDFIKLIFTKHATKQLKSQNISKDRVYEGIEKGKNKEGNSPDETVYYLPGSESDSERGIRIVTSVMSTL